MLLLRAGFLLGVLSCLAYPSAGLAQSERPSAMRLFPKETVLWLRTADAGLLIERLQGTAVMQLYRDPDLASLVEEFEGAVSDAYGTYAEAFLEADLADLLRLPQGEIAFGVVHRPSSSPGMMLLADFGDQGQVAQQVFERLQNLAEQNDNMVTTEQLRNDVATVVRDGNDADTAVAVVRRDSIFLIANDRALIQATLDHWDGIAVESGVDQPEVQEQSVEGEQPAEVPAYAETMADNAKFSESFRELLPGNEEPPQVMFFIDPVGMVEAVGGRQTGVRIAMATFPALGVDGIRGFGAAAWFNTKQWDSLYRGHLLLATPRAGVVKVARLETGETKPPSLVPEAIESCFSLRTNPKRLFSDIVSLYDRFQYEGAFRNLVAKNISSRLPIDFEEDVINNLDGSIFYVTGYNEIGNIFGAQPNLVFGLVDPAAAEEAIGKVVEQFSRVYEEHTHSQTKYYVFAPPRFRELPLEERLFSPSMAVLGDSLVLSQSSNVLQQIIEAHEGVRPRLADSLQYRLIVSRLKRMTGGQPLSAVAYTDPETMFRHLHRLATDPESFERLAPVAERVAFFRYVRDVVENAEFPALDTFLKYSSPSGSAMVDTPTGWSMIGFSYRRAGNASDQ